MLQHGNEVLPDYNFPYVSVMSNTYGYTHGCLTYMEEFFKVGTPAADKEGMTMANRIWDEQVALFNWYNNSDERTLDYRSGDIHYDFLFLHYMMNNIKYPNNELAKRYKEMKIDKVAMSYAKTLQASISSELRRAEMNQQTVVGALQELHQIREIAQMIGDNQTAQKIDGMASSSLDMLNSVSRELGMAFRNFYNGMDRPATLDETIPEDENEPEE